MSRSLTFPPGNKDAVVPNHSLEKKAVEFSTVTMSIYQDQLNAGFSKVCEIFNVCGIESLKCLRVLYTGLLLWQHFHAPKQFNAANVSRLSAISLKVWLCKTNNRQK